MSSLYEKVFDAALVRLDAEYAHERGISALRRSTRPLQLAHRLAVSIRPDHVDPVEVMGLQFANRLGMAAGFDKNAVALDALGALGFGHVEVGTVTAVPQPGNPRPRLFRLPEDRAIVNRMGFNNDGAAVVAARLHKRLRSRTLLDPPVGPIVGVNIGKSKVVDPDDEAAVLTDYERSARLLAPYAHYLVVNVSSPNTPGLRTLQAIDRLAPLLGRVIEVAHHTADRAVPVLVKIAPDLTDEDVDEVADLVGHVGLAGVIATNTTIARDDLATDASTVEQLGAGGLSGAPLRKRAEEVLRRLRSRLGQGPTLIGVGGVETAADLAARRDAGADLVQAYTGFIYGGPRWPHRVLAEQP